MPGWYGFGTALYRLAEEEPEQFAAIQGEWNAWPFLRYVIYNIESGLASANPEIMQAYSELVTDASVREELMGKILQEYQLCGKMLARLMGDPLEQRRPRFYKTLRERETTLRMLHLDQVRLLREWRAKKHCESLLPSVLLSVNAIASGLRTTG